MHPSFGGEHIGLLPFPVERMACQRSPAKAECDGVWPWPPFGRAALLLQSGHPVGRPRRPEVRRSRKIILRAPILAKIAEF
jgi:hypothetical protein